MTMVSSLRKSSVRKPVAVALLICNLLELLFPLSSYALTSGPSQPEVQSFEPVSMNQTVNPQTGDFTYSIDLGTPDYPINIAYHSGVKMEEEASNVGYGWNMSIGVLNRQMRGLPDDYNGELVIKEMYSKPNWTVGVDVSFSNLEVAGWDVDDYLSLSSSFGIKYNNYQGVGFKLGTEIGLKGGPTLGLGYDSYTGIDVSPNLSYTFKSKNGDWGITPSIGGSYSSRYGLKAMNFSLSVSHKDAGYVGGVSAGMSFNDNAILPVMQMPMKSLRVDFRASVGWEGYTVNGAVGLHAYYSRQELSKQIDLTPAYGYLYAHEMIGRSNALQDFTRSLEGRPFLKKKRNNPQTQYLAFANQSYDLYNVSGQGAGGAYRLVRGEAASVNDKDVISTNLEPANLGLEIGIAQTVKVGADYKFTYSEGRSGAWTMFNPALSALKYKKKIDAYGYPFYEPAYFKASGEMTVMDNDYLEYIGNEEPVRVEVEKKHGIVHTTGKLKKQSGSSYLNASKSYKKKRDKRNQVITYLTNREFNYCMEKNLFSHKMNESYVNGRIPRDSFSRRDYPLSQIAEMTVLQNDGRRYVYGIPAYNRFTTEALFNVAHNPSGLQAGKTTYQGGDNSKNNPHGKDNFFSRTTFPQYAHSYLLTQVLSADYVDVNDDGVTDDDLGEWVKFNYTKLYSNYKWRAPVETNSANYTEGMRSKTNDQKGTYMYGQKDIHYIHSIESRNYITEFTYSDRFDSYGVIGENGGVDTTKGLKKLDKITVYLREDRIKNGQYATPFKTIHFEYDYSLCKGVPNNKKTGSDYSQSGKLTLKKVWFTGGKDRTGERHPYEFDYGYNPDYAYNSSDRWGTYKPGGTLGNTDFPYSTQNKTDADQYAGAWHLTAIKLPSGGLMSIDYEAKDYAYVQDKPAAKMVKVLGFGKTPTSTPVNKLVDNEKDPNLYLFFELSSAASTKADIEPYIRDLRSLYFRCMVRLANVEQKDYSKKPYYEYVTGYAEIEGNEYGVHAGKGWVKLKDRTLNDRKGIKNKRAHPISRAAWQFMRLQFPEVAYPGSDNSDANLKQVFMSMVGFVFDIVKMFKGFNGEMLSKGNGVDVDVSKSFVRLYDEDGFKYGGGSRVKKVMIDNRWDNMVAGEFNDAYGHTYEYTTELNGKTISSGVATYEPIIGGDENSLKEPTYYREVNIMAPDNDYLVEKPFGESLYPAASVGYSRVKVGNLRKGGGFVVNEYYTAKDFPSVTKVTDMDIHGTSPAMNILRIFGFYRANDGASQGYSIELNDMHGKPKATYNYSDNNPNQFISGVEYKYFTEADGRAQKLSSKVQLIRPNGEVTMGEIGKEVDFVTDFNESENFMIGGGIKFNFDMFLITAPFPIPIPVPTGYPEMSTEHTKFNTAVTTKVIQKYGVLKEKIVYENGARIATENIAFDGETGEPLLTKTSNDFDSPIYNLTLPSHFAYAGMAPAYSNIGLEFTGVTFTNGVISGLPGSVSDYFTPGDEVALWNVKAMQMSLLGGSKLWVLPNNLFVNHEGELVTNNNPNNKIKIIRSGHRNMQTLPIASTTTLHNPIAYQTPVNGVIGSINSVSAGTKIIAANAVEYSDKWQTHCDKTLVVYDSCLEYSSSKILETLNQFVAGSDSFSEGKRYYETSSTDAVVYNGNFERPINLAILTQINDTCVGVVPVDKCRLYDGFMNPFAHDQKYLSFPYHNPFFNVPNTSNKRSSWGTSPAIYDHTKGDSSGTFLWIHEGQHDGLGPAYFSFDTVAINPSTAQNCELTFWVHPADDSPVTKKNFFMPILYNGDIDNPSEILGFDSIFFNGKELKLSELDSFSGGIEDFPDMINDSLMEWQQIRAYFTIPTSYTTNHVSLIILSGVLDTAETDIYLIDDIGLRFYTKGGWVTTCDSTTLQIEPYNSDSECKYLLQKRDGDTAWSFSLIENFVSIFPLTHTSATNDFGIVVERRGGLESITIDTIIGYSDCFCTDDFKRIYSCENFESGQVKNPYRYGLLGNWRKKKEWLYDNEREYLYASTAAGVSPTFKSNVKQDGIFKSFSPFWQYSSGTGKFEPVTSGWTWANEVTKYNETGKEIENVDALGRYSAALFGFNNAVPVAVAANAKYTQIGFDGAEEYHHFDELPLCKSDHYSFKEGIASPNGITDKERHTGRYSIEVKSGNSVMNVRDSVFACHTPNAADYTPAPGEPFVQNSCMCKGKFFPDSGRYYFSAWVKEKTGCEVLSYQTATVELTLNTGGGVQTVIVHPKGKIIEGWQKMDTVFSVPANLVSLETKLKANDNDAFFDDIRIQPFNSSMKTHVYDAITMKQKALLDENNYATIYEYDAAGILVREKKETEDGILMIKEYKEKKTKLRP